MAGLATNSDADEPIAGDGLDTWLNRHAVIMLAAVIAAAVLRNGAWITVAGIVSFATLWYRHRRLLADLRPYGGYANGLTALRLGWVLAAAAWLTELPVRSVLLLFAANVVIDVADGYLARRADQVTRFGAVFDREADAVFVLVAYLYFFLARDFAAWILVPGILPHAYRLLVRTRRDPPAPEHREPWAPILAGTNYLVLLMAVAIPVEFELEVLAVSTSIVAASFSLSFWNLYRHGASIP